MKLFCAFFLILINGPEHAWSQNHSAVAVIYYWKAKPGKFEEYSRYIREVAEPIDEEARTSGAFISVTTFVSRAPDSSGWSHMRVFLLKGKEDLEKLSPALNAAAVKLEPDEEKRKKRGEYSSTLRDLVRSEIVDILP